MMLLRLSTSSLLVVLCSIIITSCNGCDNCPFPKLKSKTIQQRTHASIAFSNKLGVAIELFAKKIPLDINLINEVGGKLSYEVNAYEHEPIDSVLAVNYNLQAKMICGLFSIWKQSEGKQKEQYAEMLNKAIAQMFGFVDDYRNNRPVKTVTEYQVFGENKDTETISPILNSNPTVEIIIKYLTEKLDKSSSIEEQAYWNEMLSVTRTYIDNCISEADPTTCLMDLWRETQSLSFHL